MASTETSDEKPEPAEAAEAPARLPTAAITITVMITTIMQALDMTIANVALPHMQGSMSATLEQISWVLTSYVVAAAVCMPLTGYLAARLGRRRLFIWSVVAFTVTSMACGLAQNLEQIVFFRILQGATGAFLVPLSQSVLLDTYPTEKHGWAMAVWGIGVMVGPILGPSLGGYLTEFYNWRWVFFINLPFGVLALIGLFLVIKETEVDRTRRFDVLGFLLLTMAVGAFQVMLDQGESKNWFNNGEIFAMAIVAGGAFYLFLAHIFTHDHPFVNPALFKDRNFSVGLILIFITGVILLAVLALLPPFMQTLLGYPVLDVGNLLVPRGLGTMVAMMTVGRLAGKIDLRYLVVFGLLCSAWSMWDMTGFTTEATSWDIIRTGVFQGLGLGFLFVPLATITFATLPPQFRNDGTSLFSLVRSIGSSIGISVVITMLGRKTQSAHETITQSITPFNPALQIAIDKGVIEVETTTGLVALNNEITRQANMLAYLYDFWLVMLLSLVAIPLVWLLRPPARRV